MQVAATQLYFTINNIVNNKKELVTSCTVSYYPSGYPRPETTKSYFLSYLNIAVGLIAARVSAFAFCQKVAMELIQIVMQFVRRTMWRILPKPFARWVKPDSYLGDVICLAITFLLIFAVVFLGFFLVK